MIKKINSLIPDFFEQQSEAIRSSRRLIFYYSIAVLLTTAYNVILIILISFSVYLLGAAYLYRSIVIDISAFWNPGVILAISLLTVLTILASSLYKLRQLSRGGYVLAELLGGRPVPYDTKDPLERTLLNVVEEISIASGLPRPEVFLLSQEKGINAFAAGNSPDDAVIGVTEGCLESLTRDELQGVIAHEFSHILNSDMRLNSRIIGVLHGLLFIAMAGYRICRSAYRPLKYRSGGRGSLIRAVIIIYGFIMVAFNYIGIILAKIIRCAVSRQREHLADAAAVQFTRNPAGIASALRKIAAPAGGSFIRSLHAKEAAHIFIADSRSDDIILRVFSTHPPIEERIRRISPPPETGGEIRPGEEPGRIPVTGEAIAASAGTIRPESIAYASEIIRNIPVELFTAAHTLKGSEALLYALLLGDDPHPRRRQERRIRTYAGDELLTESLRIREETLRLKVEHTLPLLDISLVTLKRLDKRSYRRITANVEDLIEADSRVSLFEFGIRKAIQYHLRPSFEKPDPLQVKYHSLKNLRPQCEMVLSTLARHGSEEDRKETAFRKSAGALDPETKYRFLSEKECGLPEMYEALEDMNNSSPEMKRALIRSFAVCVAADGWVSPEQYELIRIIGDTLGVPFPPLFPGKIREP